jgi:hypothetical protein
MTTIPNPPSQGDSFVNEVTGVTYEYDGEKWIIIKTPGSEELTGLSTRVSTGEDIQDTIRTEQGVQNSQINALETQVQLLAQTQAAGKWEYKRNVSGSSPRPPSGATFYATHTDGAATVLLNWSDARLLMVSKTDKDGNVFTFTDFQEGDKVEILAVDGSSLCIGTVVNQPSQEAYGNLIIGVERSQGGPSENKEYILSVYRPGANGGDVDLDILDQRYATSQYVDEGDQGVKDYVDEQISNIPEADPVPVDDFMTLAGTQIVSPGNWRIQQNSTTRGLSSYISIGEDELKLYHVKEPSSDHHAATKGYVDNAISGGGADGVILDLWTYKGSKNTGNDLNDGEFGSKKMANGVLELYLANKNSRGVIYHPTPPNSTAEYSHQITESNQGGSPMTVMHKDGRCLWYAETKKIVFNKSTGNYVLIEAIKYRAAFDLLVEGDQYMLNVAGFLSPVSGW